MSANVFVQTAFLGDLLLSIPVMKKIKELWPEQKLVLVCRQGLGEFFAKTQIVDEVFEVKKGDAESYQKVLRSLKQTRVERVISPHESLRTAFFVRKIRARKKMAFRQFWNGFFYDERLTKPKGLPDAVRQLSLLQEEDVKLQAQLADYGRHHQAHQKSDEGKLSATPSWASMSLRSFYRSHLEDVNRTLQKLNLQPALLAKSVALFPGSVWATKRWTEEGYISTGQKLAEQGVPVLVMGGPGEEALCASVAAAIPGAKDLCARSTIYESALVLSQVAAVVGNDSASMHLAATSETPSVVVFGPTVLEFGFRPWQDQVYVVEREGMKCRPCGKHGHQVCPLGTHACMKEIHQNEVLAKLRGVLHEKISKILFIAGVMALSACVTEPKPGAPPISRDQAEAAAREPLLGTIVVKCRSKYTSQKKLFYCGPSEVKVTNEVSQTSKDYSFKGDTIKIPVAVNSSYTVDVKPQNCEKSQTFAGLTNGMDLSMQFENCGGGPSIKK